MKEKDFLIQTLNDWCQQFNGIHVRYAYDTNTDYHIIEVDPESVRRGNELYKKAELALWIDFMEKYPDSDLLICEPSAANQMSNCLFDSSHRQINAQDMEFFWSAIFKVTNITSLSSKSTYAKSNQYIDSNEYEIAA